MTTKTRNTTRIMPKHLRLAEPEKGHTLRPERMHPIAFVLLSGGLDSTTTLYLARRQFGEVRAISMDYGQRHRKEMDHAHSSCVNLGVPHSVIKLPGIVPKTMLTDKKAKVPNISYDKIVGVSPTYVPFRNGLMLSVLTSYIHGTLINEGRDTPSVEHALFFGAHAEDAKNWAYPDCTPEFIGAMANAIFIGTYQRVRLHTPFMFSSKAQIVHEGDKLGVDWRLTWSCYKGELYHCGVCPTCRARKTAFQDAGVVDPTRYAAVRK